VFVVNQERVKAGSEKRTYVQANRPTALKLFFENHVQNEDPDTVYVVLDPDFLFRLPFPEPGIEAVMPRRFVTQFYSLQDPIYYALNACREALNGTEKLADCDNLKNKIRSSYSKYYAGVPYLLLRQDWLLLLEYWIPLIGPVLLRYPGIESDMISWSIAAAVAGIEPAQQRTDLMATCMSSERADVETVMKKQVFLHLCQSYYVPETRQNSQLKVNAIQEIPYIVSRRGGWLDDQTHVFVFNKHWLKRSKLLESCTVPLLLGPPPLPASSSVSPYLAWHQSVLDEAIPMYNRAVIEFRLKYFSDKAECLLSSSETSKALILHENHRSRFGGGWNHVVDTGDDGPGR